MSPTPEEAPGRRKFFVVVCWIVLGGFALFVGGLTIAACRLPALREAAGQ